MFDLDEKSKTVLDELFEFKEESLCAITKQDKEKIRELVKDNDTYQMLIDKLDFISDDDKEKEKIKNSLESYIDRVNIIGAYENEKFYKIRICRCNKINCGMYKITGMTISSLYIKI